MEKTPLRRNHKDPSRGFNNLLETHTRALESNSQSIVEILEVLSEKSLSIKDKNSLKKINRELNSLDKTLNSLGSDNIKKESDWFEF